MSLFDAFMGNSQREDLSNAKDAAASALATGRGESLNTRRDYLDKSLQYFKPSFDSQNVLLNALGVNGQGPQGAFYNDFQNDPGFNAATDAGINALDRSATSRGNLFSGNQLKAVSDYGLQRQNEAFNTRINQLFQLTGNAPAQAAELTQNTGNNIADTQFGYGQLLANNEVNYGNSKAASRSVPINNLLAIQETAAKVAAGAALSDRRAKSDIRVVGKLDNGLPVYSFKYKGEAKTQIGLMADDVEKVIPEAVIMGPHGFKMVNYEMASGEMK